jgi:hypothetical protein
MQNQSLFLIYDEKSVAFMPQISIRVTDGCQMMDRLRNLNLLHSQMGYILKSSYSSSWGVEDTRLEEWDSGQEASH